MTSACVGHKVPAGREAWEIVHSQVMVGMQGLPSSRFLW